jgi:hypothetical protein
MSKPYKAKSISGAQARVRQLEKQVADCSRYLGMANEREKKLKSERQVLAKLAAKGPCFYNPLDAWAAETLRDEILRTECGLNPDGTYIKHAETAPAPKTE